MRAALVFPPQASPTYVPLGLASVTAYLRREVPAAALALLDANLGAWELLCELEPGGEETRAFFRGQAGDFLDESQYGAAQAHLARLGARMARLGEAARRFVETGEASDDLDRWLRRTVPAVLASDPELVGLSAIYPEQLPFAWALARALRAEAPRIRIVLGGASAEALRADELLIALPALDGVLLGEGEPGIARLVAGAPDAAVPGLLHRTGTGGLRRNPGAPCALDDLPAPDFGDLPLDRYWNPVPVLPVIGSRGCAWRRCRFCAHNKSFSRYRSVQAGTLAATLEDLQRRHGVHHVYLADQYVSSARLDALASALRDRGLDLTYHAMIRPDPGCTPERLARIAASGGRWLSWGVESGSYRLLDLVRKGTTIERVERALRAARETGISSLAMMIFGLPGSTDADLEATFAFLDRAWSDLDSLTASGFVLFADTPFGREPERFGLEVTGVEEVLRIGDRAVRSHRLSFLERSSDGSLRPGRAGVELAAWERRRRWMADKPILDRLPVEHYLVWLDRVRSRSLVTP